jgi:hypothetical protein
MLGALILTSSKWQWHFGVYGVPAVVLAALAVHGAREAVRRRERVIPAFGLLLPSAVLSVPLALARSGGWGAFDHGVKDWQQFSDVMLAHSHVWQAAVLAALVLGVVVDRSRFAHAGSAATVVLSAALVFPVGATFVWIALDTHESRWTQPKENLRSLVAPDRCGAISDTFIVVDYKSLPSLRDGSAQAQLLGQASYPPSQGLSAGPLGEVPTWGSGDRADTLHTPTFELGDIQQIAVWTAAGSGGGATVRAVFDGARQDTQAIELPTAIDAAAWQLHLLSVPMGATTVTIQIQTTIGGATGWAATSSPVVPRTAAAVDVLRDASAFSGPAERTVFPCARLPVPVNGFWPAFDYLVPATPSVWDANRYTRYLTETAVGCDGQSGVCVYKLDYPIAAVTFSSD